MDHELLREQVRRFVEEHYDEDQTIVTTPAVGKIVEATFAGLPINIWTSPTIPPDTIYVMSGDVLERIKESAQDFFDTYGVPQ